MSLLVKGHAGEIELCFKEGTNLNEAMGQTEEFAKENKGFFSKTNITFSYSGLSLNFDEEIMFYTFLKKMFGRGTVLRKKQSLSEAQIEYSLGKDENICLVVARSLRSGEVISSRADVLVYGDVNPGAVIRAKGNITVIGALRGEAHISGSGRVFAQKMQPTQIRIGKNISYNKNCENVGSAVALAQNGEIILQCL